MANKIIMNINKINNMQTITVSRTDTEKIINGEDVKELREILKVSQNTLADILGISKKTIEKWEQGKNPIKGTASRMIFLIKRNPQLVDLFYKIEYKTQKNIQKEALVPKNNDIKASNHTQNRNIVVSYISKEQSIKTDDDNQFLKGMSHNGSAVLSWNQ